MSNAYQINRVNTMFDGTVVFESYVGDRTVYFLNPVDCTLRTKYPFCDDYLVTDEDTIKKVFAEYRNYVYRLQKELHVNIELLNKISEKYGNENC
jgi:hypothetical protein